MCFELMYFAKTVISEEECEENGISEARDNLYSRQEDCSKGWIWISTQGRESKKTIFTFKHVLIVHYYKNIQ